MNYSLYNEYDYSYVPIEGKTPSWIYNDKYIYSTMSDINRINIYGFQTNGVYFINDYGKLLPGSLPYVTPNAVRPVVLLRKKALENKPNYNTDSNISDNESGKLNSFTIANNSKSNSNNKSDSVVVSVPDTLTKVSVLSITIGLILIGTATTIIIHIKNRSKNEKDN